MKESVFIHYETPEQRKKAFLHSVNRRKEWEETMREHMQKAGFNV